MSDPRPALLAWGDVPEPGLLSWMRLATAVDLVTCRAILARRRAKAFHELQACKQSELVKIERLAGETREWKRRIVAISKELSERMGASAPPIAAEATKGDDDGASRSLFGE